MDSFVSSKPVFFEFQKDPLGEFEKIFRHAESQKILDVNAMALATVGSNGKPSSRIVLYKGMVREGFSFYTNYGGRKSQELEANPFVAATFFWPALSWQVRVEGKAEKLTPAESEAYFHSRPRLSQIGAWASEQSEEIPNHQFFINKVSELDRRFENVAMIPLPPFWGGFRVVPSEIEFWFGHPNRLHERYVYTSQGPSQWRRWMRSP